MWTFIDGGERLKKNAENQTKAAKVAKLIVAHHIDKSTRCAGCCHTVFLSSMYGSRHLFGVL